MIKIVLIIAFSIGITSCSKPTSQQLTSQIPENTLVETSEHIIFDAAKKTDQNAAEVFDLGSVSSSPIKKAFNISNTTGTNLSLSFTDLQSKISATTRFSLNLATATPCPASLKTNKSCSFEITLSKVSNESYDAIATNIISVASRGSNPEFGGMLFSGLKANDVSSTVPLSAVMRIDRLADSYIVPNGSSVTKRFYIGNVGSAILKTPGIVAPQGGTILVNSCSGIVSIKPNGTCFFEIRYTSDSAPEKASYNSEITFTSTDPLIVTTGLKIDLAITNLPVVVPVVSANFNQVGSITDLTNANGKTRLYINNTGSTDLDTATIAIPSQYSVTGTSCLPVLKVGKTCFYDLAMNVAQTSNSTAVIAPITIGSTSFGIKAGDPVVLNSPNPITTCKDGFSLVNNICETTQASCSIADATVNGVDFSRSNNTVQGMNINGDKTSCLLADNACDISSTLNPNKKSCDIKTFSVTVNKIAGQVAVADSTVGKISCGAACSSDSKNYDYGSAITLAAIAEPGYIVSNWTGCDSVVANNCVINSLTANTVVEPVMTLKQLSISTSYANAGLSGDVNSVTVYKNGNLCPSGACLNSFGINDIARIVVSPNSYINVDSFALNGSVSNLNTSVANEVSFSLQDQDVSAAISLSYKEFISQPEISYTGGNLNLSNLVTNGSSIGIVTSNATIAREMLVSTSADCSSGSYESLNLNRSFSPVQNQTSNLSIKYKNGDKYSQCFPITITHDNALPTISINTMAAINNSNKSAYTISGSCSENSQPVSISIGSMNSSVNCSSNEFSQTLDVSLLDDSASIVVSASISDLSSNVSSANSTVLKDVVAPTILINAMASINNSNKLEYTISGTCSDSSQPVSLSIGGINSSTTCNLLTFSHTMDVSSLVDSTSLATSAIITDLAGNQSEDNTTVSKDTSAPTISFNLQSIITVNNQLAYSITGNCSENGQTINIQIDTLGINTTCNSNAFSTEADVSTVADSNSVTIDASISDSNDNITHAITTTSKDTISPSLSITAPLDLASISTNTLNISGTCSDSGGISSFIVSSADFATENIVCLGNGTFSSSVNIAGLSLASHSYSVILTDISGNITTINQSFIKASSACSPETVPNSISSYGVYPSCTVISCQAGFAISSDKTSCVNGVFASITKTGTGFGQVSESFNRLNCGSDCSGYLPNENISFTASANNFSTFSGWSNLDSCSYLIPLTTPTCSFMNNGSFSATAQFSSKFSSGFVRGFDGYVHAIKPLANGQYVAVGAFNLYNGNRARGIAILNPDFSMDTSFNSTSATSELFLASYYYMDVAEDSNGRLIVVGFFGKLGPNTNYQNVARLNRDGSIDTTFSSIKFNQIMTKVNILPNKKILLTSGAFEGGYVGSRGSYDVNSNRMTTLNGSAYTNNQGILKLNENGTVDSSFSIAGVDSSVSTSSGISDVIILNDNEALIAGSVITTFNGTSVSNLLKIDLNTGAILTDYNRTELISSLMLDGNTLYVGHSVGIFKYSDYTTETIDSGFSVANFGMNGGSTMPFAYHKIVRKMIKNGNDLIVIGYYRISNSETNAYLMRFNATTGAMFANRTGYTTTGGPNGTKGITNTFTNSSQAGVPFSGFINNNNQLVIAGNFPIYRKISAGGLMVVDVSTLDPISTFPTRFHSYDTQGDMTMDASGNLYVFSKNMEDYNGDGLYSNYLLKINGTTGLPDTTFKFGNLYKYNPANTAYFSPGSLTGQNNGSTAYKQTIFYNKYDNKLYLVGTDFLVQYNSKYYMGVVRINMDGSIDTSFLANMPLITGTSYGIKFPNDGSGFVSSVDADSTGVYIGGKFTGYGTTASANIMKINGGTSTPGTLISSFAGTGLTATTFVTAIKALGTIASGNDVANNNKIYIGLTSTNPTWNGTALPSAQQRSILRVTSAGVIDTSWTTSYLGNLINSMAYEPVSGNILLGTGYTTKRLNYLTNTGAVVTASLPTLNNTINSVELVSDGTTSYFAIAGAFTTVKGGLARLSIDGLTLTTTANQSLYEDLYGATSAAGTINKIVPKFSGNGFYTINSSQIAIGSSFSYPFILDYNVNSTPPYIQLNK